MQCLVVPVTGRTKGAHKTKHVPSWTIVDETLLKNIKIRNLLCLYEKY